MREHPMTAETLGEALGDVVYALGGPKAVAADLWPPKFKTSPESAARYVSQCLDPDRREKFDIDEIEWLFVHARQIGVHTAMVYLARRCNYADPEPIHAEDERDRLQRDFMASVRLQEEILKRMESIGHVVTHLRRHARAG